MTTCVMVIVLLSSYAQDQRKMYRNDVQFNVGYTLYDGIEKYNANQKGLNRFACLISYDGFLRENLSIGAFVGLTYSARKEDDVYIGDYWGDGDYYTESHKQRRYVFGVKASTYFVNNENIQIYFGAGVALGMRRVVLSYGHTPIDIQYGFDNRRLTFMYDAHFGANYYVGEHFGITGKVGYKLALCRVGLSYRY